MGVELAYTEASARATERLRQGANFIPRSRMWCWDRIRPVIAEINRPEAARRTR